VNFHFLTTPPVGTVMMLDAQRYELEATEPYQRKDGGSTKLLHWSTHCPDCAEPFKVTTGLKGKDLARRCGECRGARQPVGKRGARIKVTIIEPGEGG
jgi:hypothetical protein